MITELKYGNTNTYLIRGKYGNLLLDTDYPGTLPRFFGKIGECGIRTDEITYLMVTHFHPDHMGLLPELCALGIRPVCFTVQQAYLHASDAILMRDPKLGFHPVKDEDVQVISIEESRDFLAKIGIFGEVLHTPGHSDDSISLLLDDGALFVGDLNPLYELELHKGTQIGETWDRLLALHPRVIYYGHAKTYIPEDLAGENQVSENAAEGHYLLVKRIMKYTDRGMDIQKIGKKTGADPSFIEDVVRMYLTHRDVSVQGILDRIEIKGR